MTTSPRTTIVLWDVDGTLVRNGQDAGMLYHEAVELAVGHAIVPTMPHAHGKTDGQILRETLEAYDLDPGLHAAASKHLDELSRSRHEAGHRRELCPGVAEAIDAFAARGWINALLTGNSANRSRYKLVGAGLDADAFDWERSYFGNVAPVRSELTIRAQEDLLDFAVVILGDTPGDDLAAHAAGIPFVAIATGVYSADDLRETGAILVVDDLVDGIDAVTEAIAAL